MSGEALPKEQPPVKQEPKREFKVITGGKGKIEEKIEEKKVKPASGGEGGWWKRLPWYGKASVIGGPFLAGGAVVGVLEATEQIDVFPESQKGNNYLTEDEQGNPVAVISVETTKETTAETVVPVETTNSETVPPTTEVIQEGPIEWEGMTIPVIEGLRFDNGTFFTKKDNPWTLQEGMEVGFSVKNAIEINGTMENSIALMPKIIEYYQEKILEEEQMMKFPIPFDLKNVKGIKMAEYSYNMADILGPKGKEQLLEDTFSQWYGPLPIGAKIYAPMKSVLDIEGEEFNGCVYSKIMKERNDFYSFGISSTSECKDKILYNGEKIDLYSFDASFYGCKLIIEGEKQQTDPFYEEFDWREAKTEIGIPLAEIISEPNWTDPDRERLQVAGLSYIFYTTIIVGDLRSGEAKSLRQKPVFMDIEGVKVSIFPFGIDGGDGAGK